MPKFVKAFSGELAAIPEMMRDAARELKNVRSLTGASMLSALNVLLHLLLTVVVSTTQVISVAFLATAASGLLYGPLLTGVIGVATDLIKYLLRPNGGFFPGFTFNEFVIGFLYGLILYKKPVTLARTLAARISVTVLVNLCLTPLWLSMMYGNVFIVLVSARIVKNIVLLPVETALLYFILKKVADIRGRRIDAV